MKVTVLQENLARGLSTVSKAVSPRSTLPVLANILIASDEGRLRLSATNLELGITCWIPARIDTFAEEVTGVVLIFQRRGDVGQLHAHEIANPIVRVAIDLAVGILDLLDTALRIAREWHSEITGTAGNSVWTKR